MLDEIGKLNDNVMLWYLMAKSSIRSGAFQVLTAKKINVSRPTFAFIRRASN